MLCTGMFPREIWDWDRKTFCLWRHTTAAWGGEVTDAFGRHQGRQFTGI